MTSIGLGNGAKLEIERSSLESLITLHTRFGSVAIASADGHSPMDAIDIAESILTQALRSLAIIRANGGTI